MTTILEATPQIRVEEIHFPTNKISSLQEFASRISTWLAQSIEVIFSPVSALVATIDCLSNNTYALKASVNYNLKVTAKISLLVYSIFSFKTEKTALLQRAMGKEHYDIARYMLYKGVSPFGKNPENSPLVIAAEKGHVDLINYMLAKGKNHLSKYERQQVEKAALAKVIDNITQGKDSWEIFHLLTQFSLKERNEPVESLFSTDILSIENLDIRHPMALAFFKNSFSAQERFLRELIQKKHVQKNAVFLRMLIQENTAIKLETNFTYPFPLVFNISDLKLRLDFVKYLFKNKLKLHISFINSAIQKNDEKILEFLLTQIDNPSNLDSEQLVDVLHPKRHETICYNMLALLLPYFPDAFGGKYLCAKESTPGFKIVFDYRQKHQATELEHFVSQYIKDSPYLDSVVTGPLKYALSKGFTPSTNFIQTIIDMSYGGGIHNYDPILILLRNGTSPDALQKVLDAFQPAIDDDDAKNLKDFKDHAKQTIGFYQILDEGIFNAPARKNIGNGQQHGIVPLKTIPEDLLDCFQNDQKLTDGAAMKALLEREMERDEIKSYQSLVGFFTKGSDLSLHCTAGIRLAIQKQDPEAVKIFIQCTDKNYINNRRNHIPPEEQLEALVPFATCGGIDKTCLTRKEFVEKFQEKFCSEASRKKRHDIENTIEEKVKIHSRKPKGRELRHCFTIGRRQWTQKSQLQLNRNIANLKVIQPVDDPRLCYKDHNQLHVQITQSQSTSPNFILRLAENALLTAIEKTDDHTQKCTCLMSKCHTYTLQKDNPDIEGNPYTELFQALFSIMQTLRNEEGG